ncbi:glycine zipper family protein [Salinisphaera sp. T31B1]|uniref:glycine zipper family protein n=1 Tax=Salinisphaera sp. T31B1 TaxID=727963 RepID=UPI00334006A2
MDKRFQWVMGCALVLVLAGCASQKPVLYPNATLNQRGQAAGDQAIQGCMHRAQAAGLDYSKGGTVRRTAESGAVGGAGGAVAGAIYGSVGRGAAAGAAGGATAGLIRSLFARNDPAPVYRSYVNRCLAEQGYEPIGWN